MSCSGLILCLIYTPIPPIIILATALHSSGFKLNGKPKYVFKMIGYKTITKAIVTSEADIIFAANLIATYHKRKVKMMQKIQS